VVLSPSQQIVLVVLITNFTGVSPFVITNELLAALSPQLLLHVALYVPAASTSILAVVAPVLHFIVPLQPLAVNVAFSVPQTLVLLATTLGAVGTADLVITTLFDAPLTPQMFSHVAVYVPASPTSILKPVAPVLHFTLPVQPVAVKVTFSVPQILVLLAFTTGATGFVNT
jgi:hypothetical protein